jgi:hypothetical protein
LDNLKGRDQLEVVGIDGRIILDWFVEKYGGRCRLDSFGSE